MYLITIPLAVLCLKSAYAAALLADISAMWLWFLAASFAIGVGLYFDTDIQEERKRSAQANKYRVNKPA